MEKEKIISTIIFFNLFILLFSGEIGVAKFTRGNIYVFNREEREPLKMGDLLMDSSRVELDRYSIINFVLFDGKNEIEVFGKSEFSICHYEYPDLIFFKTNPFYGNYLFKSNGKNLQAVVFETSIISDSSSFFLTVDDSIANIFVLNGKGVDIENQYGKVYAKKDQQVIIKPDQNPYFINNLSDFPEIPEGNIIEFEFENDKNDTIYLQIHY